MATLSEGLSSFRTTQATGHAGLLSKLQIGSSLYDIKDPAVEQLATLVEGRLSELEGKSWTAVSKGANDAKFATAVTQGTNGSISVTYGTIRDAALTDTSETNKVVKGIAQSVDGVVTATMGQVAAGEVAFTPGTGFESTSTTVQAAVEDALAKAMALKGTKAAGDTTAETIQGAKDYADAKVAELAGTDWTQAAHTVSEIIKELENSDTAGVWATMVDKMEGMSVSEKGQQGDPDYRAANANPTIVEYVTAAIEDVNAANTDGINALDAVVYGAGSNGTSATTDASTAATSFTNDTSNKVVVKVTEVDGKITGVDVKTNDVASAQALTTLDNAAVKSVNGETPTNGAVTLYAGNVALSSSDNTTVATKLTSLDTTKANAAYISNASINNWAAPSYGSETLTWNSTATTVLVPGSGNLTNS